MIDNTFRWGFFENICKHGSACNDMRFRETLNSTKRIMNFSDTNKLTI
jgi:hypothetical protein